LYIEIDYTKYKRTEGKYSYNHDMSDSKDSKSYSQKNNTSFSQKDDSIQNSNKFT